MAQFEYNISRKIFRLEPVSPQTITPQNVIEGRGDSLTNNPPTENNKSNSFENKNLESVEGTIKKDTIVGRNDPCPCGSGKKYKKCHLNTSPQNSNEQRLFDLYKNDRDAWGKEVNKK